MTAASRPGLRSSRPLRLLIGAAWMAAAVAGCSGERTGPSEQEAKLYMRGFEGRGSALRPGPDANAAYADAMALKAKGDCTGAIPKLRQVAGIGPGYEGAQTALGECLLQGTKSADLSSDYYEGLMWLRRAADAGWPEAQARLAYVYALGPAMVRNTDEAGYWLALYRGNTGKSRVGFIPFPEEQLAQIDLAIPAAAKAAGEKRAETWERKVWIPPPNSSPQAPGPTSRPIKRPPGIPRDEP